MKLDKIMEAAKLTVLSPDMTLPEEFDGVYVGDLLSRAMSRVEEGCLWLTIMNNINVIAVASLADAAAVVLCEDVRLTDEALEAACSKGVCVLCSPLGAYELCCVINEAGHE
ncbi:MAG: serine kinase [Ruminococcaceae bacterium]|nr:serine kinase [Oscillospiraceae bacterium]